MFKVKINASTHIGVDAEECGKLKCKKETRFGENIGTRSDQDSSHKLKLVMAEAEDTEEGGGHMKDNCSGLVDDVSFSYFSEIKIETLF